MSQYVGEIIAAVGIILGAAVAGVFGASWLLRRNQRRLLDTQANNQEAGTTEITDRIARTWIKELDAKVARLESELTHEVRVRRGAIAYLERVLDWIVDHHSDPTDLPRIPDDLAEYITDPFVGSGNIRSN